MKSKKFAPKKSRAQAMVEFAIVLPVLLLLLYGVLEAGRLLFMYSTIVTASRQAVRYGSATGAGTGGVARYNDCTGIRQAASKVDYLRAFNHTDNSTDIQIWHDEGPSDPNGDQQICLPGATTANWTPTNQSRLIVTVTGHFNMIVRLVPIGTRNIVASSARSILVSIPIEITSAGGTPVPTSIFTATNTATATATFITPPPTSINTATATSTPIPTNILGTPTFTATPSTGLKVQLALNGAENNQQTGFKFLVVNTGSTAVSNITVRIYFTTDGSNPGATYVLDKNWDQSGAAIVSSPTLAGSAIYYFTVNYGAASLAPGSSWEFQTALHLSSWANTYVGTNDWWHTGASLPTSYTDWSAIPAYISGTRVWGYEPTVIVATPVSNCGTVTTDALNFSGTTMRLTIHNPNTYTITAQDVFLVWNHDNGHKTSGLLLTKAEIQNSLGTSQFWSNSLGQTGPTLLIYPPPIVTIRPGDSTVIFTFDKSYTTQDNTEQVRINLSTPGCEAYPILRTYP